LASVESYQIFHRKTWALTLGGLRWYHFPM